MPNPPFQPLTLSKKAWEEIAKASREYPAGSIFDDAVKECEAQAQEAASLRQRLDIAETSCKEIWRQQIEAEAERDELKAQLAQAQQERDDANQQLEVLRPGGLYAWKTKYEQAEAALEETQKHVDGFDADAWENSIAELKRLAELQRRRSPTGQEKE